MEYGTKDLEQWNNKIEEIAKAFGLDYYRQEFEFVDYKDMLAYEAYVGMPSRYPHWSFGKAYEKNSTIYKYNLTGLPYEMVINSNPCIAYLMKENSLLLQILTIAHVYGHNDFFKNNRLFKEGTVASYTVEMFKAHADIIRSYINDPSIGYDKVERILDAAHAIKLQTRRVTGEKRISNDELKQQMIRDVLNNRRHRNILEPFKEKEMPKLSKVPLEPEEDLLFFVAKYGDLEEWERNILDIVREETAYFIPQIETKIMNEGWASFWHYKILGKLNLSHKLRLEFIQRHNEVIAPIMGSLNPYFVGFKIFQHLYKNYGINKIFEARAIDRDESFIRRYLTEQLCFELNLFKYIKEGNKYIIKDVADETGWINIRNSLSSSCGMGGVPVIEVIDMALTNKCLRLKHVYDGRELNYNYAEKTVKYIYELWGHNVVLETKGLEIICEGKDKITRREIN